MAGILANSASKTMTSGDTAADKTVSGYLAKEKITLTTSPTGSSYAWTAAKPSDSGAACKFNDDDAASVEITPDVDGSYVFTCAVDATTTYVIRCDVADVGSVSTLTAFRLQSVSAGLIPSPATGKTVFVDSSNSDALSQKSSAGTVTTLDRSYLPAAIPGADGLYVLSVSGGVTTWAAHP